MAIVELTLNSGKMIKVMFSKNLDACNLVTRLAEGRLFIHEGVYLNPHQVAFAEVKPQYQESPVKSRHVVPAEYFPWRTHPHNLTPLDVRADVLELPVRCANALHNAGIVTIRDLIERSESDFLRLPNFGRVSLLQIREIIKSIGLVLGMSQEEIEDYEQTRLKREQGL